MTNQKKSYIFAVLSVIFWSTVASAFKITLRHIDLFQMLFYSSFFSIIILLISLVIQKKFYLLFTASKSDIVISACSGFLNPFLYYLVLFGAYSVLPAQEAVPLNYTWPVILVIISAVVLKQKISLWNIIAIIISFTGVVIISTHGNLHELNFSNPAGVFLALGSAVIWSTYWILTLRDRRDETVKLLLNFFFGFIYTIPAVIYFSDILIPAPAVLGGVIYIGTFEMGITFLFWAKALKLSETTARISNLLYITPFLSLLIINFAVGEKITRSTITGLLFIIAGIILQAFNNYRKKH